MPFANISKKEISKIRASIALIITLCTMTFASAMAFGSHSIEPWAMNSRLTQSTILSVLQDSNGMLWLVNLDGITRFDGKQFVNYRTYKLDEGRAPSVNIIKIVEILNGMVIAVSRDAGLLKYDKQTNSFINLKFGEVSPVLNSRISEANVENNNFLWIGYEDGAVSRLNFRLQQSKHFTNLFSSRVNSITTVGNTGIQAASVTGKIIRIDHDVQKISSDLDIRSICNEDIYDVVDIFTLNKNLTIVGTRGSGLYFIDFNSRSCTKVTLSSLDDDRRSEPYIHQIYFEARSNLIWIASDQGIYQIDQDGKILHFDAANSNLSNNEVIFISSGIGNTLWVGTYKGLNYLLPTQFESFTAKDFDKLASLVSIGSLSEHELLIASYDGLISFNKRSKTFDSLKFSHPEMNFTDEKIMSTFADKSGIWIGYRSAGLEFFERDSEKTTKFKKGTIPSDSVSAILTTGSGETLIGTHGGGFSHLNKKGEINTYSVGNNRVMMITEGTDGAIWISTESSLHEFHMQSGLVKDVNLFHLSNEKNTSPSPLIWEMTETSDGDFWLGSVHDGLFYWSKEDYLHRNFEQIEKVTKATPPLSTIYSIETDQDGNAWCSTNNGLIRILNRSKEITRFSRHHGLHSAEFDYGVSHKDSQGKIYFGGSSGYIAFDPTEIDVSLPTPKLSLISIGLPSKSITLPGQGVFQSGIRLEHSHYFVTFAFSVIDFLDPEKNQYRYKLENFDPEWIENGNRNTATYTNLPAGNYVFRVQGANSAGIWNRDGISLNVTVLPAPWFSWWAFCVYALLLSVTLWLFKRAYDSFSIKRRAQAMAVQMHATEERADDDLQEQLESQDELIRSMYRHNTTTLGLISDYISIQEIRVFTEPEKSEPSEAIERVESLSMLEECLHFYANTLCADLHKFADMLISRFIRCSSVRPETITTINRVSSDLVPVEIASPIAVVMHELLKNSFQHAFDLSSTANYLQLDFNLTEATHSSPASYQLTVMDSGIGIPGIIDINNPETTGLVIVKSIADRIGGQLHLDTSHGTVISLKVPVSDTPLIG